MDVRNKTLKIVIFLFLILASAGIVLGIFREIEKIEFVSTDFISLIKNIPEEPKENPKEKIEVVDGILMIRELDKEMIAERIEQGKEFLYRMEHDDLHGFYKQYNAEKDSFEERLHTVYSASIIYTFLYVYDYNKDEKILAYLDDWGSFLLSMQETDKNSSRYGAFSYSYFLDTQEKPCLPADREQRYVVGTSALSIFTLLRLHEITGNEKYLSSAKIAGDWLVSMQREDGVVKPYVRYNGEEWVYGTKLSLLYNGQSLSALSKLYAETKDKKYYNSAKKIADLFAKKYEQAGRKYVVGEYRTINPISNTWLVMSLMDFHKASGENYYKEIVFELSSQIISNQFKNLDDLFNYGRIDGAYSTSGNGWISEVMTDTYSFCLEEKRNDCEKYKTTVLNIIRWIMARTYSEENVSLTKNPQRSLGGVFWNKSEKYVRTDSVCHGLNGYTRLMKYLDEGTLLSI